MPLPIFEHKIRVEFEDLDVNGHVYSANYVNYFERARSAALASRGLTFREFMQIGVGLVIAEINLKFRKPAFLYEDLYVYTRLTELSERSMTVDQLITKEAVDQKTLATSFEKIPQLITFGKYSLVCVDMKTKKPSIIPPEIRKFLE